MASMIKSLSTFVMQLLDRLLQEALDKKATDLHIIFEQSQGRLLLRQWRSPIEDRIITIDQATSLIEFIHFKSHFKNDGKKSFFDLSFSHNDIPMRISYSFNKTPYLTLRLHLKHEQTQEHKRVEQLLSLIGPRCNINIIGPINSGKTTLYYKMLSYFYQKKNTVLSVEDPIEKKFDFWQVNLNSHEQWLQIYENIIRYDLDLIGFGEIRKKHYLKILNKIYLAGHQVLTTFHAQSLKQWYQQALTEELFGCSPTNLNLTLIFCQNHRYELYQWELLQDGNFQPLAIV